MLNNQFLQFNEEVDRANTHWQTTNESITAANRNWSQTNNIAGSLTDPLKLGILVASGGAGFVIGSALAKTAISVINSAYLFLREKMTHEKEREDLIQRFRLAHHAYNKAIVVVQSLENSTAKLISIFEKFHKNGITFSPQVAKKVLNTYIGTLMVRYQITEKEWEKALKKGDVQAGFIYRELEESRNHIKSLKKCVAGFSHIKYTSLETLIEDQLDQQLIIERQIESFRTDVADSRGEYYRRLEWDLRKLSKKNRRSILNIDREFKVRKRDLKTDSYRLIRDFQIGRRITKKGFELEYSQLSIGDLREKLDRRIESLDERGSHIVNKMTNQKFPLFRPKSRLIKTLGKIDVEERIYQDKSENYEWGQSKISQKKEAMKYLLRSLSENEKQRKIDMQNAYLRTADAEHQASQNLAMVHHFFDRLRDDQIAFKTNRGTRKMTNGVKLMTRFAEIRENKVENT